MAAAPTARQVELILAQVSALPTLSPVATRLLEAVASNDAETTDVVRLIESDPAMSARILSLCRRADTGLGQRITTVQHAVVMLGLGAVQAVVLSVSVLELARSGRFDPAPIGGFTDRFDRPGFWRHSIAVACAADLIARAHPSLKVKPAEAFVAGLLADLGKLALATLLPRAYSGVIATCQERGCASASVERAVLGIDHHTAGKRLGEHWALPHALQDVMWFHGQPPASIPDLPHKPLILVVSAAEAVARRQHLGWSGEFAPAADLPEACVGARLDPTRVEEIIPRLHEEVAERCRILGVDAPEAPEILLRSITAANSRLGSLGAALEARARQAREQARVLASIQAFQSRARAARGLSGMLAEVARSASGLLGGRLFVLVTQTRSGEEAHVARFSGEGDLLQADTAPLPGNDAASLARLLDSARGTGMSGLGLLPWLSDYAAEADDVRQATLLPLLAPGPEAVEEGAAALLHEGGRDAPEKPGLDAIIACWSTAIASSMRQEGASRLSEDLAETNRALVEAQARLAEAQSLARLGEMAAGAAHEMNNPLAIIAGRAQLLCSRLTEAADRASGEAILRAANDLSDLITSLRLVASPPKPRLEALDAREVIELALARFAGEGRVRVRVGEGASLRADRELIASAVAELIANALEASPDGIVEVAGERAPEDGRLLISVKDHGPGLTPRAMEHAFDPFFSEKPAGRRTGLGLTRARRLVELHGGTVTLGNAPGGGVLASIRLPASQPERTAA